ncbi:sensor histidine kinase [Streptacidiphilus carbonis]|uniref:sensor histidine kinase n=1 Tax=Streptacidiphilus carbonis TaxID=105422 RepID=UPI000694E7DD|nr:histidine kinase [Streptacidiphilus carbonis]
MTASPRFLARRGEAASVLRWASSLIRVVGLLLVGLLLLTGHRSVSPGTWVVQLSVYALLCLGTAAWCLLDLHPALRPRRPRLHTPVLAVVVVAGGLGCALPDGDSLLSFAMIGTMIAATEAALLPACAVAVGGILAASIGAVAYGDNLGTLLGYPLLVVVGLLVGRNRRGYQVQAEQSAALLAQFEQLQEQQRRTEVLDERARIAREIHDVLAHSLGALGIQIQVARAVLTDSRDVDKALETLAAAQRMASEGLVETRRAVHAMRTDQLPLDQEITRAADTHTRRHGAAVAVSLDLDGPLRPLPPDATLALLRIVQEALVNAAKHAPGAPVELHLRSTGALTAVTVTNPITDPAALPVTGPTRTPAGTAADHGTTGVGGSVGGGYGLIGMRERLRLLNGTLTAGPQGDIWTVTARLPHPAVPHPAGAPTAGPGRLNP